MRRPLLSITAVLLIAASATVSYAFGRLPALTGAASVAQTPLAVVNVANANAGTSTERSLCLTFGIVRNVVNQCGALRISHSTPAIRTYDKARDVSLVYSSDWAANWAIINVDIALETGVSAPTSVRTTLYERTSGGGEVQISQRTDDGSYWSSGPQRVGLRWTNATTGVLPYRVKVEFLVGGVWTSAATAVDGEQAFVQGNIARGWRIGGEEALVATGSDLYWIGGDGSTRLYKWTSRTWSAGGTSYRAFEVASSQRVLRPDTIIRRDNSGTVTYARLGSGLSAVIFDHAGRHSKTFSRLGDSSIFHRDASTGRLDSISVAPTASNLRFKFGYGSYGRLTSVSTPGLGSGTWRVTTLAYDDISAGDVATITDPDSTVVSFDSDSDGRITSRTDRRSTVTDFTYESLAPTIASMTTTIENSATIVHTFQSSQGRSASTAAPTAALLATKSFHDGPLSNGDTTGLWVSRIGAMDSVRNALGHVTKLSRDTAFIGRITQVVQANGMTTNTTYDARGNVATTVQVNPYGDSQNATTTYTWDQRTDVLTKVKYPEGDSTAFAVDTVTGNVLWEQPGPHSARKNFSYASTGGSCGGRYHASSTPGHPQRDTVWYSALCNTTRVITPMGVETRHTQDRLGRDSIVGVISSGSTFGKQSRTLYTTMDRPREVREIGDGFTATIGGTSPSTYSNTADTLLVTNTYNAEGDLTSVVRHAGKSSSTNQGNVASTYTYDKLSRRIASVEPGSGEMRMHYDKAGHLIWKVSPMGDSISHAYDVVGRLITRIEPSRSYAPVNCSTFDPAPSWIPAHHCSYTMPRSGSTYVVDADTAVFSYDIVGNLVRADNQYARIRRTYFANGALQSDTQKVRTFASAGSSGTDLIDGQYSPGKSADFTSHVYALQFKYDKNGRRRQLRYPSQFTGCGTGCVGDSMVYDGSGRLSSIKDGRGYSYSFQWDSAGYPRILQYGDGSTATSRYDADGRRVRHLWTDGQAGDRYNDSTSYDYAGRLAGLREYDYRQATPTFWNGTVTTMTYAGLGQLGAMRRVFFDSTELFEGFKTDAIGQRYSAETRTTDSTGFVRIDQSLTMDSVGKLTSRFSNKYFSGPRVEYSYKYFADGSTKFVTERGTLSTQQQAMYYGSNGKLRLHERRIGEIRMYDPDSTADHAGTMWTGDWPVSKSLTEEYRYDALGRRVLLRYIGDPNCVANGCESVIQRFIWDGAQIVGEFRARGESGTLPADLESDVASGDGMRGTVSAYGRVWYIHAGGIDHPIGVIRFGGGTATDSTQVANVKSIYPFLNSRGQYEGATYCQPQIEQCTGAGEPAIEFAGSDASSFRQPWVKDVLPSHVRKAWAGSLLADHADQSGLKYQRNRYYDPATGRFTQVDPIGIRGGLGVYTFAGGDPVNFVDPFGLWSIGGMFKAAWNAVKDFAGAVFDFVVDFVEMWLEGVALMVNYALDFVEYLLGGNPFDELFAPSGGQAAAPGGGGRQSGSQNAYNYDRGMRDIQAAEARIAELQRRLEQATGPKSRNPILKELQEQREKLAGHRQAMREKFPNGRPPQ